MERDSCGPENDRHNRPVHLSVVVPVYEEESCLEELQRRLTATMQSVGRSYEIIFVDDGSRDGSLDLIKRFAARDPNIRFLSFTRNFGQAAALTAGQIAARGEGVIGIDADLQNPPEEIPKLLARYDQGYDIVYGIRRDRQDPWFRRACSAMVTKLLRASMHVNLEPSVTAFTIIRRGFIDELNRCPEHTRFYPALCAYLGAKASHVDVRHDPRFSGRSKYIFWKLLTRALDLLTGFTHLPLRLASWGGLLFSAFGFSMALWAVVQRLVDGRTLMGWASTMAAIGLLGGMQLLTIGVLGEYLGRAHTQLAGRPLYVIRETGGLDQDHERLRFPRSHHRTADRRPPSETIPQAPHHAPQEAAAT